MQKKCWLSWSSGKDSAWTLYQLQQSNFPITALFTTVNQDAHRVCMHATRIELLRAQATALGLPLHLIEIPDNCSHEHYQHQMSQFIIYAENKGVTDMAFGDLFLENVRDYRIESLKYSNIQPLFPLWKKPTHILANDMIQTGLKAIITCVDTEQLSPDFLGQPFTKALIEEFPKNIDPCGENGEFHSFVYDAPNFKYPLQVQAGEVHISGQFHFIDVLPD